LKQQLEVSQKQIKLEEFVKAKLVLKAAHTDTHTHTGTICQKHSTQRGNSKRDEVNN